jgi:23S rRNA pseudouridine1911/1915/1917 synthase
MLVIYENDRLLIVDKPANLLVHPTKPGGPNTLWDELRKLLAFEIINGGQVSIVNRLDRETSGLVLVAKSTESARALGQMLARHQIRKLYQAIVWGWPDTDQFTVDQPLLRQGTVMPSKIWLKQTVHPNGYPALTSFRVLRRFTCNSTPFTLIEAEPKSGRTHQVRVHLSHAGCPIVGDKIYGPDENYYLEFIASDWTPELQSKLLLPRQALHASGLEFVLDSAPFNFSAPLPQDMEQFIERERAGSSASSGN